MRITVKATVVDDDGSTYETDVAIDWDEVRIDRKTGERHVYGTRDVWFARLPPRKPAERDSKDESDG